ncbi:MAG: hypothetical protein QOJ59_3160 [Thermomicrobiales bacterium]|jgi:hypothetical protein|nr:hypothetical protein [Thermomicrobiales bacterium]
MTDDADLPRQAVIAYFKLSDDQWGVPEDYEGLDELEQSLIQAIDESGVGEFDGIARGLGFFDMYMYGPSADALFDVVEPLLRAFSPPAGSYVVKQYGEPGAEEVRVDL